MISRTKRRLAVLPLALGLITAAPYGFSAVVDSGFFFFRSKRGFSFVAERNALTDTRVLHLSAGFVSLSYFCFARTQRMVEYELVGIGRGTHSVLLIRGALGDWHFKLPHESITLRVACALLLAGVCLLVIGGRMLCRRWLRADRN